MIYFSNAEISMLLLIEFASDFSSFRIDSKPDKYLSNTFDLLLLARQVKVTAFEIENEGEQDIENLFDLYQILGPCFSTSEKGLSYPLSIFDRHSSWL